MDKSYIIGSVATVFGQIPQISTRWSRSDICSTMKVRWNIGRMKYAVEPELYAVGNPDETSAVFVSANFKLSFDHLRRALRCMNAWILVLDTNGINVWCAAGKGTFGTDELVKRIKVHALLNIVNHRKIIVPQLGAVGVSAHEIKNKTGFQVIYGPVRAEDIPAFVTAGFKASEEMRTMKFPFWERIKLIPVELTFGRYYMILVPTVFFILAGLTTSGYSIDTAWSNGGKAVINLFAAYFAGSVFAPSILPFLPFRRFSLKGLVSGWLLATLLIFLNCLGDQIVEMISWYLIMGAISSFLTMNFTGASTFTSLSGVQKEMKMALPMQIGAVAIGFIGWMITRFI